MTLGAFISSAFIGIAAKKFGRRQCLWAACILCCVANIIMMATTNIGALYCGRLLIGFANGYFMTASQVSLRLAKCLTLIDKHSFIFRSVAQLNFGK